MKKLGFLLLLIPAFVHADEFKLPNLQAGMYSNASANKIPDNAASYIQNFYSDIDDLAIERNGYAKRDSTVLGGTKPVYGLWDFTDSSGNNWIISYSSRTYYKNTIGGTPTAFGPISTTDNIPDCAKNIGMFMCVNGIDTDWTFDGTSTANVSGAPLGQVIEPWRTRFAITNIAGARSTVRISADGSATNWTIGALATDPFSFQIGGANDGEYIRCLVGSYLDSMIVGRRNDLWAVDGFDQSDFVVRNISDQVGCIEPRTPKEVDGELVFLSARGLEAMNGRSIRQISDPIRNITDVIVRNTSNLRSFTQSTQSDWINGTYDQSIYVDTETVAGNLQTIYPDGFSTFRDGTSGTKKVWVSSQSSLADAWSFSSSGNQMKISRTAASTFGQGWIWTFNQTRASDNSTTGTTYYLTISSFPAKATHCYFVLNSAKDFGTLSSWATTPPYFWLDILSTTTGKAYLNSAQAKNSGGSIVNTKTSGTAVDVTIPFTMSLWMNSGNYQVKFDNTVEEFGTHTWPMGNYFAAFGQIASTHTVDLSWYYDNFSVAPQTFTYLSPVNNAPALTTWDSFSANYDISAGSQTFFIRASTGIFTVNSTTPSYSTITSGSIPTTSTGTYFQIKDSFSLLYGTATVPLTLNDFTQSWVEGGAIPSPVSCVYDRRYWISFTTTTSASPSLDTILVWQRNKSFTLLKGLYAGSFAYWKDNLYFGNSNSTGYVYKFDTGNNDDSSDITSMIITKSYDLGQFYRDKEFSKAYLGYLGGTSQTGSFSLSYDLNRYGTPYSLGSVNLTEEQGQGAAKFWFPLSQLVRGREIQYTLLKSGTGSRLKLYDLATQFELKEEK